MNFYDQNNIQLGGEGVICQADKSLFRRKPKHHVGRCTECEIWVFGIADTSYSPSKLHMECVSDRYARKLIPIIKEFAEAV